MIERKSAPTPSFEQIELITALSVLWQNKLLVLFLTVSSVVLAVCYLMLAKPVYEITAKITPPITPIPASIFQTQLNKSVGGLDAEMSQYDILIEFNEIYGNVLKFDFESKSNEDFQRLVEKSLTNFNRKIFEQVAEYYEILSVLHAESPDLRRGDSETKYFILLAAEYLKQRNHEDRVIGKLVISDVVRVMPSRPKALIIAAMLGLTLGVFAVVLKHVFFEHLKMRKA